MHVDGGAATQVFLYPPGLSAREVWKRQGVERERTAWVIRNGRVDVASLNAPRGLFSITARSAQTLLHFAGICDLPRIYLTAIRDDFNFRLQVIGRDFAAPRPQAFDTGYMQALFEYGRTRGRNPQSWLPAPPPVGLIAPSLER
jgi:hypothetical protein